ncbi:MAG: biopolymer transporter ExbD [Gemmatimonadetes bacterium]|nr:biopolymer transporter ExbD [Gemmatimonadota bacterium]
MAIQMGKTGRSDIADINMTPMIDVLLVLLVIFMVAQPLLQRSIDMQLPVEKQEQPAEPAPQIVLEIDAQGRYFVNTQPVGRRDLERRLHEIFDNRPDKVLFIKADGELIYQDVIEAMDVARGAGVKVLGSVLPT